MTTALLDRFTTAACRDAVEVHQPQHLRPNDNPQYDFEDHRRNTKSDRKLGENGPATATNRTSRTEK